MQLWRSKGFQEYDYGRRKNLEIYHSETPPSYNLTKATVPIALFVGLYDFMGHREVRILQSINTNPSSLKGYYIFYL